MLTLDELLDLAALQREAMTQSYTRIPRVAGTTKDAWNQSIDTQGTPIVGLPCVFVGQPRGLSDAHGQEIAWNGPALVVPPDDTLAVGDQVRAITGSDGTTVLANGPFRVDQVVWSDGRMTSKAALLEGAEVTR